MSQSFTMQGGGSLHWEEQGGYIHFSACKETKGNELYKVWLQGHQTEFLLGTLIPEAGQLRLRRTISRDTLQTNGCWPARGARCGQISQTPPPSRAFDQPCWSWEHFPSRFLTDPVLVESADSWGAILFRKEQDSFSFAAPFDPHRPFPFTPVFCLATVSTVDLHPHIIFSFTQEGIPHLPRSAE